MKLDVYGRFQLEVLRENDVWVVYQPGLGTRVRDTSFVIPAFLAPEEIARYLDDIFHEISGPGNRSGGRLAAKQWTSPKHSSNG